MINMREQGELHSDVLGDLVGAGSTTHLTRSMSSSPIVIGGRYMGTCTQMGGCGNDTGDKVIS